MMPVKANKTLPDKIYQEELRNMISLEEVKNPDIWRSRRSAMYRAVCTPRNNPRVPQCLSSGKT